MVDIYGLIMVVFGILGWIVSGGSGVWLFVSGVGVGIWVGVALLLHIRQGRLAILMIWEIVTRGLQ